MNTVVDDIGSNETRTVDSKRLLQIGCHMLRRAEYVIDRLSNLGSEHWNRRQRDQLLAEASAQTSIVEGLTRRQISIELRSIRRALSDIHIEGGTGPRERIPLATHRLYATRLLLIWLALYFNGTPYVELWQTIMDYVSRSGSLPTLALSMKAYGDIYRIERRRSDRFIDDARIGINPYDEAPLGIATAVNVSILLDPDSYLNYEKQADIPYLESFARKRSQAQLWDCSNENGDAVLFAITERLARIYCSIQVMNYACSPHPLKMIWLKWNSGQHDEFIKNARRWFTRDNQSLYGCSPSTGAAVDHDSNTDTPNEDVGIQPCVLNSYEGVVRNLGLLVGVHAGRSVASAAQKRLRQGFDDLLKDRGRLLIPSPQSNSSEA